MRIVYLGSPLISVLPLDYLIQNSNHQVIATVSQPPKKKGRGLNIQETPLGSYAKSKNITALCPQKASDEDFIKTLSELNPDLCITCAYGQILPQKFLDIPKYGTINIHPSKLPKHRGATPIQSALLNGETKTSITILFTVKKMDAGPIIQQKEYPIKAQETSETLSNRLFKESGALLVESIDKVRSGFKGIPQNENDVTICKKILKDYGLINWSESVASIYNKYRAFTPWPGVHTFYNNKRIILSELATCEQEESLSPGEFVFNSKRDKIIVGCQSGLIEVGKIKKEGKKFCSPQDFWNGLTPQKRIQMFR